MHASLHPANTLNQSRADLGIPFRFKVARSCAGEPAVPAMPERYGAG